MCGIVGVINTKEENKEIAKKIFKSLVIANESRGKDSTGVLAIDRDSNEFSLFKDTIPAIQLMNRKKFRQVEGDVWIGHTRLATTGEVNIRNAHPLQRGEVFLAHNGVISNHIDIGKSLDFEHEVDSEILIPIVEKQDWDLLQDIKGSANFIAWNRTKQELYVERHDNPLYCLTLKQLGIVMFSSVESVLEFVSSHYSSGDEVFIFPPDTLTILDMWGNLKTDKVELKFPVEVVNRIAYPMNYDTGYSKYSDERYPLYNNYDEYSSYSGDSRLKNLVDDDDEEGVFGNDTRGGEYCEVCGCEIDKDEHEYGLHEWGYPLCYSCITELDIANGIIRDEGKIDLNSQQWKKYSDILSTCI